MKKALLVIDVQKFCVGESHAEFFHYDGGALLSAVNRVIEQNERNPVIYIQNMMKRNAINRFAPFQAYEGTPAVELADGLNIVSNYRFSKYRGDAFSNSELKTALRRMGVEQVELVGVDGGGCVALTAFGALREGFQAVVNTSAVQTIYPEKQAKFFRRLQKQGAEIR